MRRVTCKDCHHSYDYDRDDFCPRCGSFNPPRDPDGTKLERDLLARFGDGRANQGRAKAEQAAQSAQGRGAAQWRPGPRPDQGHANHTPIGGAACEETPGRGAMAGKFFLALGIIVILGVLIFAGYLSVAGTDILSNLPGMPEDRYYESGETFAFYDMDFTAEDVRWLWVPSTSAERERAYPEYQLVLLVDIWVEGGGKYHKDRKFSEPVLCREAEGGGMSNSASLDVTSRLKPYGVYTVQLSDTMWEDPLSGQLVFWIGDADYAWTGPAFLVIEEINKSYGCVARNVVSIALPPIPESEVFS